MYSRGILAGGGYNALPQMATIVFSDTGVLTSLQIRHYGILLSKTLFNLRLIPSAVIPKEN